MSLSVVIRSKDEAERLRLNSYFVGPPERVCRGGSGQRRLQRPHPRGAG